MNFVNIKQVRHGNQIGLAYDEKDSLDFVVYINSKDGRENA